MAEQTPESTEPNEPVAFNITDATDEQLLAEYGRVKTAGTELSGQKDADPAELSGLATQLQELAAVISERKTAAEATQAARDAFASAPDLTIPTQVIPEPAAPAVVEEPAVETPPAQVPSVSQMAAQTTMPQAPPVSTPRYDKVSLRFSSDAAGVMGRNVGEETDTHALTEASRQLFGQFGNSRVGGGIRAERALGKLSREREFRVSGDRNTDARTLKELTDYRRRLPSVQEWEKSVSDANSLTAAAGWCAPSEIRYDLCSLWERDGFIDLPTMGAPRGGVQYSKNYLWREIMDAGLTSFTRLTEAQVIADTPKNCTELPCPSFTERRLDVAVTCITGSFLQDVGYPENVANLVDGLLLKHEVEINRDIISQIVTQAGAAIVIPPQGATPAPGSGPDTSAVASFLAGVDIAAIDMRYRERMSFNRILEVAVPQWIVAQWRADISRRNGYHTDPFAAATTAEIARWFSARNLRPQFLRDWQDAQSGLATGPGDITAPITPITAFPNTVDFLIWPAGAIVLLREDVVTLTNVYDSTNLKQNLYTALFTEEGYAPIFPCGEVKRYTVNACPSGATADQVWTSCAVPAAAA
ncbi:major capsid protein [Streptomyces hydrogenans]|uniref:major capsid protein n=2 Tax=Actinomycetes TaxID=1760 RepID=UPI0033EC6935